MWIRVSSVPNSQLPNDINPWAQNAPSRVRSQGVRGQSKHPIASKRERGGGWVPKSVLFFDLSQSIPWLVDGKTAVIKYSILRPYARAYKQPSGRKWDVTLITSLSQKRSYRGKLAPPGSFLEGVIDSLALLVNSPPTTATTRGVLLMPVKGHKDKDCRRCQSPQ